ncbi:MAG: hypothetical protein ACTSU9_11765 [Promethearchaeota archaeon]
MILILSLNFNQARKAEMQLYMVKGVEFKDIREILFKEKSFMTSSIIFGIILGFFCGQIMVSLINANAFNNLHNFLEIKYQFTFPVLEMLILVGIYVAFELLMTVVQFREIKKSMFFSYRREII